MKRAILYALVIVTIMTLSLVTYDMHQRQTLIPTTTDEGTTAGPKAEKATTTDSEKVTVIADVKGLRTTQGQIIAQLYDDLYAFNNYRDDQAVATIMTPSKDFSGELRFHNLAKKKYALVLFHDANSNQKFDQNGAVMEGYAYSNNVGKTSLPNFHQAAFTADKDKTLIIHLIYH